MVWDTQTIAARWTSPDPVAATDDQAEDRAAREAVARAAAGELLGSTDLAAIFRLSPSHFHKLAKAGRFDHLKVRTPLGPRCYSGVLVHRFLAGEAVYEPTFGRKRARL